MACSEAKL